MPSGAVDIRDFATRYTAAWCSQDPARVAGFFSDEGSLTVNDSPPAVGRIAIAEVARSFMAAFPDLTVVMDNVSQQGDHVEYRWTLTGTNTGLGGAGGRVCISGFEKWRMQCGFIEFSQGHFDAADYRRQLEDVTSPGNQSQANEMRTDSVRAQVIQVVEQYINAVRRNDASALPLHPDAVCEFPTNTYRGATAFQQGLNEFARIVKSIDVVRLIVDGDHCVAIIRIDTVFGPIPFAEHIHVVDGRIVSIRGYCDPRPMLSSAREASA
jgi:ketosteroid isomerase-like protein